MTAHLQFKFWAPIVPGIQIFYKVPQVCGDLNTGQVQFGMVEVRYSDILYSPSSVEFTVGILILDKSSLEWLKCVRSATVFKWHLL